MIQLVKNPPAMWETWVRSWVGKISWRRERLPSPVGEFHGLYSPWGCKELDMTPQLLLTLTQTFYRAKQNKPENPNKQINKQKTLHHHQKKKKKKEIHHKDHDLMSKNWLFFIFMLNVYIKIYLPLSFC